VIFVSKYVSRVVFKGGILGGTRQFRGNPYLNSTTVLFDILNLLQCNILQLHISTNKALKQGGVVYNIKSQ